MRAEDVVRRVLEYVERRTTFLARGGFAAPVHAALREIEALDPGELTALLAELESGHTREESQP